MKKIVGNFYEIPQAIVRDAARSRRTAGAIGNLVRAEEDFFGYSQAGERHVWTLSKSHNTYS